MDTPTTPTAKPWWQSKTVLLNAVALVAMLVPVAREWIEKNPVTVVQALAAVGLILRFVTSGKISIFGDDDDSLSGQTSGGTGVTAGKSTGRDTGGAGNGKTRTPGIPWLVAPACVLLFLMLLPSCTVGVDSTGGWSIKPDPLTIDAGLKYLIRHEEDEDGSKAGLTQWEYYDPATGEKIKPEDYAAWGITASPAE
jgi:hypothetical protein